MGRIRTKWVKNIAKKIVETFPEKVSSSFEDNKKFLEELNIIEDKSIRNKIAGYIVDLVGKKKIE